MLLTGVLFIPQMINQNSFQKLSDAAAVSSEQVTSDRQVSSYFVRFRAKKIYTRIFPNGGNKKSWEPKNNVYREIILKCKHFIDSS